MDADSYAENLCACSVSSLFKVADILCENPRKLFPGGCINNVKCSFKFNRGIDLLLQTKQDKT